MYEATDERVYAEVSSTTLPDTPLPLYKLPNSKYVCKPSIHQRNRLVLIGAIGGSGTRAVQELVGNFGWFGGILNPTKDSQSCHVPANVAVGNHLGINYTMAQFWEMPGAGRIYRNALSQMFSPDCYGNVSIESCFWGWKNPRNQYLIPLFNDFVPTMKLILVVRDGRDVCFSRNQRQFNNFFAQFSSWTGINYTEPWENSIAFWNEVMFQR